MSDISISFIIPTFNSEKHISNCLKSIIKEMNQNDEIVIVDNGSTDHTINIVKSYKNINIFTDIGLTIGGLRNMGAAKAKGNILAFIDSDCIICSSWRNAVAETLQNQTITACGSKYGLPENPNWIERAWFSQKRKQKKKVNYINSGNLIVRKKAFLKIGGFDSKLITGEDSEFGLRLNEKSYIIYENPEIRTIHLGNPENLFSFYKQQRWHGLGMFGTQKISKIDKPVVMTILFLLFNLIAIAHLITTKANYKNLPVIIGLSLAIPTFTSFYRIIQYKNIHHFPQLIILYFIYFAARTEALFRIMLNIKAAGSNTHN